MSRALLAALAVAAAAAARPAAAAQSPRVGSFDLGMSTYRPNVDSEAFPGLPPGSAPPYERIFGDGRGWMLQATVSRAIFTRWGSLELGVKSGWFSDKGKALQESATDPSGLEPSADETKLKIVPTSLVLTYRFDWPVERWRIPLAPYGRAALERYNWWVTDGTGSSVEKGATNGWSASAGLAFLLDVLDPMLARDFDRDSGVNHTYVYFEATWSAIDDFGSGTSWDLSDEDVSLGFGLTFAF